MDTNRGARTSRLCRFGNLLEIQAAFKVTELRRQRIWVKKARITFFHCERKYEAEVLQSKTLNINP